MSEKQDVIEKARAADLDAVAHELVEASSRASAGLYTEAVMRLGRATEATLYGAAREFGIKLQLHIPKLGELQDALRGVEAGILRKGHADEVRKLADISKQLAQAIVLLMEDSDARSGQTGERVRGNDSILSEIVGAIEDPSAKRRLGLNKGLLLEIMGERNSGAHASPTGDLREADRAIFPELEEKFYEFIEAILDVTIGKRSRNLAQGLRAPTGSQLVSHPQSSRLP
jgi:hypothetical protein